ncbi:snare associated Golgi protein-domain-containing protein [Thamnidium elegans]|nr:snare associated Golgi protein-domain-containing protein [Thamnidium elegans]
MSALIFSSAFPPVIGYGTYQTLSGFTFGFQIGFPISYFSALLGAIVCFSLSRMFLKARVARMLSKYPNLEAVVHAVEKKGFKLFILIRLSPYPFNLLNVVFAATNISLFHFAAGTALTLLKIALHVYIGANLTSLAKHILGEEEDLTEDEIRVEKLKSFAMVVGTIITFIGMAYIYRVAKAAIKEANLDQPEHFLPPRDDEEEGVSLTLLGPSKIQEPRDSISIDNWDDWGDEDSEEEDITLPTKFKKDEVLAKTD